VTLALGVDVGGTFTDLVLHDASAQTWLWAKVPTDAADPARSVLSGLDQLLGPGELSQVALICHATTLGINAIVERRGARTGLVVTEGFADVLEMGSGQRYDIYDLFPRHPEPLVPAELRVGVPQRRGPGGEILKALDLRAVRQAGRRLAEAGVSSIAVCFLHSYSAPADEESTGQALHTVVPGAHVTLSSEVVPEIREYPRLMTSVANAYIQPLVSDYMARLAEALAGRGFGGRLLTMLSGGGMASVETACAFPVRLLESGPVAGAVLAQAIATQTRSPDLMVFDMGGTTAKMSLVAGGEIQRVAALEVARVHRFKSGSGIPIKTPALDLIEIGAGGGSIARLNQLGMLAVGPESAGAEPGPACYGAGGTQPTVTDANLLLGYLDPDGFLGGRMRLSADAAAQAMESLARPLGMTIEKAAWFLHATVNESMAGAARVHLAERGLDAGSLTLLALGGAGPLHADRVAREAGLHRVMVPPDPGVGSAAGLLLAPRAFEVSRSFPGRLDEFDWARLSGLCSELENQARELVLAAGADPGQVRIGRSVDMQVEGQVHEIEVWFARLDPEVIEESFVATYERLFHHPPLKRPRRAVTWRLRAWAPGWSELAPGSRKAGQPSYAVRRAYFPETGSIEVPVHQRAGLPAGFTASGPLIVAEAASTTVACPGSVLSVLEGGSLELALQ
jgi:5-oxoprolinase (ATP-hydrolysing)